MKRLVPVPRESVNHLKQNKETGFGYQVVSVQLKDGRYFDQAVASEGCIIAVRGCKDVPFAPDEVERVTVNHKPWNFRESSDTRRWREKSMAAGV
ncbi:MAG TPA: hypothetical protein VEI73_03130 [Candidatus Acidoferrum sp.]|nr:hypothetical protein [Candidatus Acidoferrum sp.]